MKRKVNKSLYVVLAIFLGQDIFGIEKVLAAVLVFLGVYVVTKSKSRQQIEEESKAKSNS